MKKKRKIKKILKKKLKRRKNSNDDIYKKLYSLIGEIVIINGKNINIKGKLTRQEGVYAVITKGDKEDYHLYYVFPEHVVDVYNNVILYKNFLEYWKLSKKFHSYPELK